MAINPMRRLEELTNQIAQAAARARSGERMSISDFVSAMMRRQVAEVEAQDAAAAKQVADWFASQKGTRHD